MTMALVDELILYGHNRCCKWKLKIRQRGSLPLGLRCKYAEWAMLSGTTWNFISWNLNCPVFSSLSNWVSPFKSVLFPALAQDFSWISIQIMMKEREISECYFSVCGSIGSASQWGESFIASTGRYHIFWSSMTSADWYFLRHTNVDGRTTFLSFGNNYG